jgi:hypothetical protein
MEPTLEQRRSPVRTLVVTWAALMLLTVLSLHGDAVVAEVAALRWGAALTKLILIAWVFMELSECRRRWFGIALALFLGTIATVWSVLPPS